MACDQKMPKAQAIFQKTEELNQILDHEEHCTQSEHPWLGAKSSKKSTPSQNVKSLYDMLCVSAA